MKALTPEEKHRYSRQLNLPEFDEHRQLSLKKSKVLVVGAGGLGSALIMYLAASGIGEIGIIDFDVVEIHNLHRQILFTQNDIGKYKVDVAKMRVNAVNSDIICTVYRERLSSINAEKIFAGYHIVADGSDNFSTRYLVNDCCVKLGIPNVFASILRFEGQLSVFNYKGDQGVIGPNYRDLFLEPPKDELIPNCAEGGILGPVAGILACFQANEILKIASGMGTLLSGKLMILDLLHMETRLIKIKYNPKNPIRFRSKEDIVLMDLNSIKCNRTNAITVEQLKQEFHQSKNIQVVDVRESSEYELDNIGASNIPVSIILQNPKILETGKTIILHCQTGKRSKQLIQQLEEAGCQIPLTNLTGGIEAWRTKFGNISL